MDGRREWENPGNIRERLGLFSDLGFGFLTGYWMRRGIYAYTLPWLVQSALKIRKELDLIFEFCTLFFLEKKRKREKK